MQDYWMIWNVAGWIFCSAKWALIYSSNGAICRTYFMGFEVCDTIHEPKSAYLLVNVTCALWVFTKRERLAVRITGKNVSCLLNVMPFRVNLCFVK